LKCRFALLLLLIAVLLSVPASPALSAGKKGVQGKVTLLPDQRYFDALRDGIRNSKKTINGCFFLFKVSEKKTDEPKKLIEELIAASRRGVVVSIELEQDTTGKGAVYEQNRRAANLLIEGGVKVRFDPPKTTTHVKAMVIDDRYVYVGSHNLTRSALLYNRELSVMIDSPELAAEVTRYLNGL
jgi:hypothetical protein